MRDLFRFMSTCANFYDAAKFSNYFLFYFIFFFFFFCRAMEDEMWGSSAEFPPRRYLKFYRFCKERIYYALKFLFVFTIKERETE
jgi:hypothetical protein